MIVVGVGLKPEHLTKEAIEIIRKAKRVYGSRRAIQIAEDFITGEKIEIKNFSELKADEEGVYLSTGDPMVSGLGSFFLRRGYNVIAVPGISSVQLALAKLGMDLCECAVVSAHAREGYLREVEALLELKRSVVVLGDRNLRVDELLKLTRGKAELYLCENLGYKNEAVRKVEGDVEIKSSLVIAVLRVV